MSVHTARPYQRMVIDHTLDAWRTSNCVLVVMPTGSGKTFVFASIAAMWQGGVAAIAHRSELVSQMSLALAREGVRHRVIGAAGTQRRSEERRVGKECRS